MPLDTAKIDAQIRKLQELKRIAGDPEMAPLLESLIVKNGLPSKPTRRPRGHVARAIKFPRKGDLMAATSKAIASFNGRFTALSVLQAMKNAGFVFEAETPLVAVNGALRRLLRKKRISVAVVGSGRAPHQYERIIQKTSLGESEQTMKP
jgi:hypothetical protein